MGESSFLDSWVNQRAMMMGMCFVIFGMNCQLPNHSDACPSTLCSSYDVSDILSHL